MECKWYILLEDGICIAHITGIWILIYTCIYIYTYESYCIGEAIDISRSFAQMKPRCLVVFKPMQFFGPEIEIWDF